MNEDFCSYELSMALKACGFDEPCDHYYCAFDNETDVRFWSIHPAQSQNGFTNPDGKVIADAPTLAHAQKWLREKKGIVVIAEPDWDSEDYCMADYLTGEWYFSVWKDGDRVHCNFDPNAEEERIWMFDKYEQALSAGIAAALELIKEGE